MRHEPAVVPRWLTIGYGLFMAGLVPVHLIHYGATNFLWASDIALVLTLLALWRRSALFASMAAVGTLVFEIGWTVAFLSGGSLIGGIEYMFDTTRPLWLRGVSLYHVALPVLLIWLVHRLGYDSRALAAYSLLTWLVVPATFLLTDPAANINWVHGPGFAQTAIPPLAWLAVMMVGLPLLVYLPTHLVLRLCFAASTGLR